MGRVLSRAGTGAEEKFKQEQELNKVGGCRALNTSGVWTAYREIGGVDGVSFSDLRAALMKLRDANLCKELNNDLQRTFSKFDGNGDGIVDALEFEQMIRSSALLERAIYQFLLQIDNADCDDDVEQASLLDIVSAVMVLLNVVMFAIRVEYDLETLGWQLLELAFICYFVLELVVRGRMVNSCSDFVNNRFNLLEVTITVFAGVGLALTQFQTDVHSGYFLVNMLRILRMSSFFRLVKVLSRSRGLALLFEGIISGLLVAVSSFAMLGLLTFIWAVIMRECIRNNWLLDEDQGLEVVFPNILESMLVLFRCSAIRAEGACLDRSGVPYFTMLADRGGVVMQVIWVASEIFVGFGVLNAIISVFVVQGIKNDEEMQVKCAISRRKKSKYVLRRLDKLLRSLTQPKRAKVDTKDRNSSEVAAEIAKNYPRVAAAIPDLSRSLVKFAEGIQATKEKHENAMCAYEASETAACEELLSLPSAQTYLVDGEELLLADMQATLKGCRKLGLQVAPSDVLEKTLIQGSTKLDVLLAEAREVQTHVKSIIWPGVKARRLADDIEDPGPKKRDRVISKVDMKYRGRFERNRDYSRLGLVYNSVQRLLKTLKILLELRIDSKGVEVVRMENRFAEPSKLGWRDVSLLLKVRVPSTGLDHIMELQLNMEGMKAVRDETHDFYEKIRVLLPEVAVNMVIDRLTNNTTLDLDLSKQEWAECLKNVEVRKLLDKLKVPEIFRLDAIDIVDADGSGKVSTAELQHGLLLSTLPPAVLPGDVMDAKLKVRDMQQWLKHKLEPQLYQFQELLISKQDRTFHALTVPGSMNMCSQFSQGDRGPAASEAFSNQYSVGPYDRGSGASWAVSKYSSQGSGLWDVGSEPSGASIGGIHGRGNQYTDSTVGNHDRGSGASWAVGRQYTDSTVGNHDRGSGASWGVGKQYSSQGSGILETGDRSAGIRLQRMRSQPEITHTRSRLPPTLAEVESSTTAAYASVHFCKNKDEDVLAV